MPLDRNFEGAVVALMTSFDGDGNLDIKKTIEFVDYMADTELHGLFVAGTAGEGPKLSVDEKKALIRATVEKANGRVAVLGGAGGVATRDSLEVAKYASDVGADAAVLLPPYYYRPSQSALFDHYSYIASKVDLPIFLYNLPSFVGYTLDIELVSQIVGECSNVIGVKDSGGNLSYSIDLIAAVRGKASVFQGIESLLLSSLIMGAKGAVVSTANVAPKLVLSIFEAFKKGDLRRAIDDQFKLALLDRVLSTDDFISSTKEALKLLGMDIGTCRKPCSNVTPDESKKIKEALDQLSIRLATSVSE
jgi:4-hydroxy-tetrahydrodipicolinate synthase